jgi:hypothetical protein
LEEQNNRTPDKLATKSNEMTRLENADERIDWQLKGMRRTEFPHLLPAFLPPNIPRDAQVELVITANGNDIPIREFAAYLALVDRLYGRLSPGGLMSYSHIQWGRLQISDIHRSDLEIIFRLALEHPGTVKLLTIMLFLKGLPRMLKNTADAYKSYQEARLIQDRRLQTRKTNEARDEPIHDNAVTHGRTDIGEYINEEPALHDLPKTEKDRLVDLLEQLYLEERSRLPTPIRFAREQIRNISFRIRK